MAGWLPGSKGERKLAMAVMVVLLLGTLAAVGAARQAAAPKAPPPVVEAETPAALPLTGWTILVDPGHGGYDGGARARDSGTWEKHINLAVARQVPQGSRAEVLRTRMPEGPSVVITVGMPRCFSASVTPPRLPAFPAGPAGSFISP